MVIILPYKNFLFKVMVLDRGILHIQHHLLVRQAACPSARRINVRATARVNNISDILCMESRYFNCVLQLYCFLISGYLQNRGSAPFPSTLNRNGK